MKFNLVDPPYSLEEYYSKYPEGLTIYEALLSWLETVNQLIDSNNSLDANVEALRLELDSFLATVPPQIQTVVETILNDWLTDGTLETLINDTLFNTKADKTVVDGLIDELNERIDNITVSVEAEHVQLIAHRGFAAQFPENTLFALQSALSLGCRYLEYDVQFSSDSVPILMHDLTVDRTTTSTGNVSSFTAAQLTAMDAGADFNNYFTGIKVPTLEKVLNNTRTALLHYIEIKNYATLAQVTSLVQLINNLGMKDRVILQSFQTPAVLPTIRAVSSDIKVGALATDQSSFNALLALAQTDPHVMLLIPIALATVANRLALEASNVDVGVWTINNHSDLHAVLANGYTKVMTNKFMEVYL